MEYDSHWKNVEKVWISNSMWQVNRMPSLRIYNYPLSIKYHKSILVKASSVNKNLGWGT